MRLLNILSKSFLRKCKNQIFLANFFNYVKNILRNNRCSIQIFTEPVVVKGSIEVNKFIGQDIQLKQINNNKWTPERWLRYKVTQNVTGPVKIGTLVTDEINTSPDDPTFESK